MNLKKRLRSSRKFNLRESIRISSPTKSLTTVKRSQLAQKIPRRHTLMGSLSSTPTASSPSKSGAADKENHPSSSNVGVEEEATPFPPLKRRGRGRAKLINASTTKTTSNAVASSVKTSPSKTFTKRRKRKAINDLNNTLNNKKIKLVTTRGRKPLLKNVAKNTENGKFRAKNKKFKLVKRRDNEISEESEELEEDEEEEDLEEEEELKFEDEWIEQLLNDYWVVRLQFEAYCKTDGVRTYNATNNPKKYEVFENKRACPFNFKNKLMANKKLAKMKAEKNSSQKCMMFALEAVQATPVMQYWTLTEVNVIAEDEFTLSHIPFLGDAEDDTDFCAELQKTFPDGIHGTLEGCGQYINDWILYYTVKRVREALPNLDLKTIFQCIHNQFPNKASVQNLITMYPDLQIRFEPESIDRQELTNSAGELVANFSTARLLNSYEVLICHKCFSYDCTMHNATSADGYSSLRKYGRDKRDKELRPCLNDCYMQFYNTPRRTSDSKIASKSPNEMNKDIFEQLNIVTNLHLKETADPNNLKFSSPPKREPFVEWTPHEEAVMNMLRSPTNMPNYCKITDILNMVSKNRRTCRQIYEYACRTAPLSPRMDLQPSPVKNGKKKNDNHRTFRAVKWANTNGKVKNHAMYKPCNHRGECSVENGCRCVTVDNLCTKYCPCNSECKNRFPGCRCSSGNCRTRQCQCYYASWECDPDICKNCNCDKFDASGEAICKNVSIQRGLQKRLLIGPSQVAGWGCFSQEDIEKNEFISEYCGEVITQGESERRGKIYDKIKCSYLFGLNDEQVVDATRVGNVIRFANHSRNPNCRAQVIVVNGDHKIGIFANRHIKRGEELFFDYAYNKSQQVAFLSKELPKNFQQQSNNNVK